MAQHHHHHSHASDISPDAAVKIQAYLKTEAGKDETWLKNTEQVLCELAFYSQQNRAALGGWSMGELDRFVTEYLPGHIGSPELTASAPGVIVSFSKWLQGNGAPSCDIAAIEKRMRKIATR
jgi:hypothetical protein